MCYDDQARPPQPPGEANPARGEDLTLTAADGNRFNAYAAYPVRSTGPQIIIYPDVRGLHQFYKELAMRFAEVGMTAVAIDYFGRTAGLTSRDDTFEFMPHVQQLQLDTFFQDVEAAQNFLREKAGKAEPQFVVGFCMGGALSLLSGTEPRFGFAGLVPFYAGLSRAFGGRGTVLENAEKVGYPVLGLFGGADQGIPQTDVDILRQKLDTAGVEHNVVVYPGAPHSFFDRRSAEFADASTNAWSRILEFITSHSGQKVAG